MGRKYQVPDFSKKEFYTKEQLRNGEKYDRLNTLSIFIVSIICFIVPIFLLVNITLGEDTSTRIYFLRIFSIIFFLFTGVFLMLMFIYGSKDLKKYPEVTKIKYNTKYPYQMTNYLNNIFLWKGFTRHIIIGQLNRYVLKINRCVILVVDVLYRQYCGNIEMNWMQVNICKPKNGMLIKGVPMEPITIAGKIPAEKIMKIKKEIEFEFLKVMDQGNLD